MVADSDFSGLVISDCARASAAAMAPIDSLDRCMATLLAEEIKADGPGLRPLRPHPETGGFLRIFRHKRFQGGFCGFMLLVGRSCPPESGRKLRPAVGPAHVDGADRFQPGSRRFNTKHMWDFAVLDASP